MSTQSNIASNSAVHSLEDVMSFSFPTADHIAAETFCPAQFAEVACRKGELRTLRELTADARDGIEAVIAYCLMANDDIALVRVGVRGGKKVLWNFGQE